MLLVISHLVGRLHAFRVASLLHPHKLLHRYLSSYTKIAARPTEGPFDNAIATVVHLVLCPLCRNDILLAPNAMVRVPRTGPDTFRFY